MRLVHDEEVERMQVARPLALSQELLHEPLAAVAAQPGEAHDGSQMDTEWIGVKAAFASHRAQLLGVDDMEVEPEAGRHLVPPLGGERGGADDHDAPGTVAEQQLLDHEAGLDGLPEAHVVRHEQVHARKAQGPDQRLKLVVLDGDAGTEGRLEHQALGVGHRSPSERVEEGAHHGRLVEAPPARVGEGSRLQDAPPRLNLPEEGQLLTDAVVVNGG